MIKIGLNFYAISLKMTFFMKIIELSRINPGLTFFHFFLFEKLILI